MNPSPIGIFDSGVGGLTVWREIRKLLPNEQIIYFADSKNCPYGNKPQSEIIHLAIEIVSFLLNKNCKLIVVACNTATAAAIEFLRQNYSIPFVGMEPAVKHSST
jgi:glutamate racemase